MKSLDGESHNMPPQPHMEKKTQCCGKCIGYEDSKATGVGCFDNNCSCHHEDFCPCKNCAEEYNKKIGFVDSESEDYDKGYADASIKWETKYMPKFLKEQREELVDRLPECSWCDLENGKGKYLLESDILFLIKEDK